MIAVIQRVENAGVTVKSKPVSNIGKGILVLLGIEKNDDNEKAKWIADKIVNLRIFPDENNKMNLSLKDINGEILVVSQFTLPAKIKKGRRPSFDYSENPKKAEKLYENFCQFLNLHNITVKKGIFGAIMNISLINNGPVTFILKK